MLLQLKDQLQKNSENVVTINVIVRKQIKLLVCKAMGHLQKQGWIEYVESQLQEKNMLIEF